MKVNKIQNVKLFFFYFFSLNMFITVTQMTGFIKEDGYHRITECHRIVEITVIAGWLVLEGTFTVL